MPAHKGMEKAPRQKKRSVAITQLPVMMPVLVVPIYEPFPQIPPEGALLGGGRVRVTSCATTTGVEGVENSVGDICRSRTVTEALPKGDDFQM